MNLALVHRAFRLDRRLANNPKPHWHDALFSLFLVAFYCVCVWTALACVSWMLD